MADQISKEPEPILAQIEAFLDLTGMAHGTFGRKAARNARLVERLRGDANTPPASCTGRTERKVRKFLAAELRRRGLVPVEPSPTPPSPAPAMAEAP